jgi:hypothetical protein
MKSYTYITELCFIVIVCFIQTSLIRNYQFSDFHGYEPIKNTNNNSYSNIHTIQMSDDVVELGRFHKTCPKLSKETLQQWRFMVQLGADRCHTNAGLLLSQHGQKESLDGKGLFGQTTTSAKPVEDSKSGKTDNLSSPSKDLEAAQQWLATNKDGIPSKIMSHVYSEMVKTLESVSDITIAMNSPMHDAVALYDALVSEYSINTRTSRFTQVKELFNLKFKYGEKFSTFVSRIESSRRDINSMAGAEIFITDALLQVVLIEGVKEDYAAAFEVPISLIEQSPKMTFIEMVNVLKPTASRLECEGEKANKASEGSAVPDCWAYQGYGSCAKGNQCKFKHTTPGNKRCEECNGKHHPTHCPKRKERKKKDAEKANKAQVKISADEDPEYQTWKKQKNANKEKANRASTTKSYVPDSTSGDNHSTSDEEEAPKKNKKRTVVRERVNIAQEHVQSDSSDTDHDLQQHPFYTMHTENKKPEPHQAEPEPGTEAQTEPDIPALVVQFAVGAGIIFLLSMVILLSYFVGGVSLNKALTSTFYSSVVGTCSMKILPNWKICKSLSKIGGALIIGVLVFAVGTAVGADTGQPSPASTLLSVATATSSYPLMFEKMGRGAGTNIGEFCAMGDTTARLNTRHFKDTLWAVDSACTSHICNQIKAFDPKSVIQKKTPIEIANGKFMMSDYTGNVTIRMKNKAGTINKIHLTNVLYVAEAKTNLISVGKLVKTRNSVLFDDMKCKIKNKDDGTVTEIQMVDSMFEIKSFSTAASENVNEPGKCYITSTHEGLTEVQLWHNRLAHGSDQYIKKVVPGLGDAKTGWCEACTKGGMKKAPYNKGRNKGKAQTPNITTPATTRRLQKVMADTCAPYPSTRSAQGSTVFFIIMDIHTRKTWIMFAKSKTEFPEIFKKWVKQVETETQLRPVLFMPDGGTEFTNEQVQKILQDNGIKFQTTSPGNPNQNPFVERMNGVVQEKVRKLLEQGSVPQRYWQDASKLVVEIQNAMPHRGLDWDTPNQRWEEHKVADKTIDRVKTFGCESWFLVNNHHTLKKGAPKWRKGVHLGFSDTAVGYKILDLGTRKIVNTRDVYFHENRFPFAESKESRSAKVVEQENEPSVTVIIKPPQKPQLQAPVAGGVPEQPLFSDDHFAPDNNSHHELDDLDEKHQSDEEIQIPSGLLWGLNGSNLRSVSHKHQDAPVQTRRQKARADGGDEGAGYQYSKGFFDSVASSKDTRKPSINKQTEPIIPVNSNEEGQEDVVLEIADSAAALSDDYRNQSRQQVMNGALKSHFEQAEQRELDCIELHGTWEVVDTPTDHRKPITCRWVYDVKRDADNNITVYKARLTAHGFKQKEGVDFHETFAAVAQMKSFRTTCALSQLLNLNMTQIDISNAFLHGDLEEEIYMHHPPGYKGKQGTCLKLKKGLYGLKQAGRIWNTKLISTLKQAGFVPLISDSQILHQRRGDCVFIVGVHVDDITLSVNNEEWRKEVLAKLRKDFLVKDLGPLSYYLGIKVQHVNGETKLSQQAYIEKVVAKFNMEEANEAPTPGATGQQLSKEESPSTPSEKEEMMNKPYRSLVGSLMYAYIGTRIDIGSTLIRAAAFCENPGRQHWIAVKRILRYLKGTKDNSITYSGSLKKGEKVQITVYCDSDWAQDRDDRKSISGYVVKIAGGPISWQSKKQPTRAMSSCEAEFISLTEATKEVLWLTYFLDELQIPYDTPVIFTDSKSAMEWTKNACHHQRTKHVALKYFFIRDIVRDRKVQIQYVSTKENQADILTKSTSKAVFEKLRPALMGVAYYLRAITGHGA